jgi:hypothetical protein
LLLGFVTLLISLAMTAGAARADDLLVLNGDTETLSGGQQFGIVYIDGVLQLAGDTSITASSIYIGPDAQIDSCYVAGGGGGGDACTNGRSLSLASAGPLTVATPIDLTGGHNPSAGGSLSLSGNPVSVGADITTAGSGGNPSGTVSIASGGTLSTGAITAPAAPVSLTAAGSIDVGGDIQAQGNSGTAQTSAAPVTIDSSGGDVRIGGNINASGASFYSGSEAGGNGAAVTIAGTNVRTEQIATTGGSSQNAAPGSSAAITIEARGSLAALGDLSADGSNGAGGTGANGAAIALTAAGPLTIGGDADTGGGQSGDGAAISVTGSPVTTADLNTDGGDGSSGDHAGGSAGAITVTAPAGASLGVLTSHGGAGDGLAYAGNGGTVNVVSSAGPIAVTSVQAQGGDQNDGPGAPGGSITLNAATNLSVGQSVDASGSDANGSIGPPWSGGDAGSLTLDALAGTLTLGGNASAQGGDGSQAPGDAFGGTGGAGGPVQIVAAAVGALASLSSAGGAGGNYGDTQGPGGAGGPIVAFTVSPIFNDQQLVSSDGGDGNPTGIAGDQQQDIGPTGLAVSAAGTLSFTSQSPNAQYYRVLMTVGSAAPAPLLTSAATSGLVPKSPVCVPVTLTVVAVNDAVGWTSAPSAGVVFDRRPSASQSCSDPPALASHGTVRRSLRQLRRARWTATLPLATGGPGQVSLTLARVLPAVKRSKHHRGHRAGVGKTLVTLPAQAVAGGRFVLHISLPAGARAPGSYTVRVTTISPDGKGHHVSTLTLEIT